MLGFSVKVKLTVLLFFVCVHSAYKGHPQNDLYCVKWGVKPYTLTRLLQGRLLKILTVQYFYMWLIYYAFCVVWC